MNLVEDSVAVARVSEGFLHKGNKFLASLKIKERDVISLPVFSSLDIKKLNNIIFVPDSPESSQRSPLYLLDPGTKHDAHKNGVC